MSPTISLVRLLLSIGIFLYPGWIFARWLDGASSRSAKRVALSFTGSLAAFCAVAWPFLWWRGRFGVFCITLGCVWVLLFALSTVAWRSARQRRGVLDDPVGEPASCDVPYGTPELPQRLAPWLLFGYLLLCGISLWMWPRSGTLHAPAILLVGAVMVWWLRAASPPTVRAHDQAPPPLIWWVVALAVLLPMAISAALMSRPDWDDCYYLSAVEHNRHGLSLNDEEPTHHEGLPPPVQQRALCWELFLTVLCTLSGFSPMALAHGVLPAALVLLCFAAYQGLFAELLPRRWVPLGLLAFAATNLWWISSHHVPGNYLLTRPWQAKALLVHLCLPLAITQLLRLAAAPKLRTALSLIAVCCAGLGVSLSALFLLLPLCSLLGLALVRPCERRGQLLLCLCVATLPIFAAAVGLKFAIDGPKALLVTPPHLATWSLAVRHYRQQGSLEMLWILLLPIAPMLIGKRTGSERRARAYLIVLPALLGLTFLNPFLYHEIAQRVTTYLTYFRMWWLLPTQVGVAVLMVHLSRWLSARRPFLVVIPLLLATSQLPGLYVWDHANSFIGPLGEPSLAANVEKLPGGLKHIADNLLLDPKISDVRILCNEQVASFLAPYDHHLRFVETRPSYTAIALAELGRASEALERHWLATTIAGGPGSPEDPETWRMLRSLLGHAGFAEIFGSSLPRISQTGRLLLERYRVRYAITGPGDLGAEWLTKSGFRAILTDRQFILWQRDPARR